MEEKELAVISLQSLRLINESQLNVSIIVPTHNRLDSLRRLIENLEAQGFSHGTTEIVVAADHCSDGTVEWLRQNSHRLRFAESAARGAASARNAGIDAASGEVLIFVDDDMTVSADFVEQHEAAHRVAPNEELIVIGYCPVKLDEHSSALARSLAGQFERYFASLQIDGEEIRDRGIPGGNFSARADLVKRAGGFDQSLLYREDVELGIRLRRLGARIRFARNAVAVQHGDVSLATLISRAAPRATADLHLASRYPDEVSLLEMHRAVNGNAARRMFRVFWAFGSIIDPFARVLSLAAPQSVRLGSLRYRSRYAQRLKRSVPKWRDFLEVASGRREHVPVTRVLHLLGSSQPGGVETFVMDMCRHVDRSRFVMSVCIMDGDGPVASELRKLGIDVHVLGRQGRRLFDLLPYANVLAAGRFDILHAHAGGRLHRHMARYAFGLKVIRHLHGIEEAWIAPIRNADAKAEMFFERTFASCDLGLVCSQWFGERVKAAAPNLQSPIEVLRNGVDVARFEDVSSRDELKRALDIPPDAKVVGFVGRMVRQKGISSLAAIAARVSAADPAIFFVVVGGGPLAEQAIHQFAAVGVTNVRFTGSQPEIASYMSTFDVLAVTSDWEPFGIVSLEAMSAGVPVVAFGVDGIPEVVVDGETGLLVTPADVATFADKLFLILRNDPLRASLGKGGAVRASTVFRIEGVASSLATIYTEVMAGLFGRSISVK